MLTRLRLLSPLGSYPAGDLIANSGRFIIEDDIAVSITEIGAIQHNSTPETVSEIEFLTLEEARFLGCLTISWPDAHGMLSVYPIPYHIDIPLALSAPRHELLEAARQHALTLQDRRDSMGLVLPPAAGGPNYGCPRREADEGLVRRLCDEVLPSHNLMIRGLAALIRADMLWVRREFGEAAIATLHIALEATMQIIFDILRREGNPAPSSKHASDCLAFAFGEDPRGDHYFAGYYQNWLTITHPASRFGTFISPPLLADDFYDLRSDLIAVYIWLLTGQRTERNSVG